MELFFREYGSGQPLIVLHGLFGMSDNWVTLARKLAERFHVYLPDLRNHGQSPHSAHHSYPAMADDLDELINKHQLEYPIIMGHSMGGKVAMHYATENPMQVQRLIVIDISPKAYNLRDQHLDMLDTMKAAEIHKAKTREEVEKYVRSVVADAAIQHLILKNLYRTPTGLFAWRINTEAIYNNLENIAADDTHTFQFNHPALFIRGALSDYILDEDQKKIRILFPQAELITIPGAGHWVHVDAPKALCKAIRDFTGKECTY
jgi:esterase